MSDIAMRCLQCGKAPWRGCGNDGCEYAIQAQHIETRKTCHILRHGRALCGAGMPSEWPGHIWCDAVYWAIHCTDAYADVATDTIETRLGPAVMCKPCVDALTSDPP